jgi:hypothetical protein
LTFVAAVGLATFAVLAVGCSGEQGPSATWTDVASDACKDFASSTDGLTDTSTPDVDYLQTIADLKHEQADALSSAPSDDDDADALTAAVQRQAEIAEQLSQQDGQIDSELLTEATELTNTVDELATSLDIGPC